MQGRIIKQISNDYTVKVEEKEFVCKCRGIFRKEHVTPLVGDFVLFDEEKRIIEKILPRKNELVRPPVSNIDQAILITSVKEPDFSTNLLDKLLTIIEYRNIKPIIILTKLDLLTKKEEQELIPVLEYYQKYYSVYKNTDLKQIKKILKGNVSVFTGQSGSGKSTLLNHLDESLQLQTGEISKALGRGKHTTRHVELLSLFDGLVADTPGFSSIDFKDMSASDIRDQFIEFELYKEKCKYQDCMHAKEEECEIKKMVEDGTILKSRYENYLKFIGSDKI